AGLVDDRLVGVARSSIRQADGILLVVVEPGERVADVGNAEHRAYIRSDEPRLAVDEDGPDRVVVVPEGDQFAARSGRRGRVRWPCGWVRHAAAPRSREVRYAASADWRIRIRARPWRATLTHGRAPSQISR